MGIYSPCVLKKKDLGPKPAFFGHRGAPMVGLSMMSMDECRYVRGMWNRAGNLRNIRDTGEERESWHDKNEELFVYIAFELRPSNSHQLLFTISSV